MICRTCFVSDRPHEQIDTSRICHHIDFISVDRNAAGIAPFAFMVVLLILQFRLADEKQSFDKLLHILGERRRQI